MLTKQIFTAAIAMMVSFLFPNSSDAEESDHSHAHFEKNSQYGLEKQRVLLPYLKKKGVKYSKAYILSVDLSAIGLQFDSPTNKQKRATLSPRDTLLVWDRLVSELPVDTKFALGRVKYQGSERARIKVYP